VLPGEGIGPEVVGSAIEVLRATASAARINVKLHYGKAIGREAEKRSGRALSQEVIDFCEEVFSARGAILSGPGGGRYVYDLRKRFDLFFKISPIQAANGLLCAARLKAEMLQDVDLLVTRENSSGAYQGRWKERITTRRQRVAGQQVVYSERQVRRFLRASARLARLRRGNLTVVWKESGIPTISRLWRDCAEDAAKVYRVHYAMVDIDLMAYRLIQDAPSFDVIAAPNLFGDVLADLGAVLLGSRGLSYSGNFDQHGRAVYQTNHGAAYDLAGADRANPVGQILSLAMMLRESFGLFNASAAIEQAVKSVWDEGFCTADVAVPGRRVLGTAEMGTRIAERVEHYLQVPVGDC
jgi:3-isopropylmalate dehydrogenase